MKFYNLQMVKKMNFRLGSQPKPFPGKWPTRCYWQVGSEEYFGKPAACQVRRFLAAKVRGLYSPWTFVEFDRGGAVYISDQDDTRYATLYSFYYHWQRTGAGCEHLLVPLFRKRIAGYTVLSPYSTLKLDYVDEWRRFASDVLERRLRPAKPTRIKASGTPTTSPLLGSRAYEWAASQNAASFQSPRVSYREWRSRVTGAPAPSTAPEEVFPTQYVSDFATPQEQARDIDPAERSLSDALTAARTASDSIVLESYVDENGTTRYRVP